MIGSYVARMSVKKIRRFENVIKLCQLQLKLICSKSMHKIVISLSFEK